MIFLRTSVKKHFALCSRLFVDSWLVSYVAIDFAFP
jgi:hypothetical protein